MDSYAPNNPTHPNPPPLMSLNPHAALHYTQAQANSSAPGPANKSQGEQPHLNY
jgi:hypothetical protein